MKEIELIIRPYADPDRSPVVALWNEVFPDDPPWNAPEAVIARKLTVQPELFLVGDADEKIVAAVLAGYDGVRRRFSQVTTASADGFITWRCRPRCAAAASRRA